MVFNRFNKFHDLQGPLNPSAAVNPANRNRIFFREIFFWEMQSFDLTTSSFAGVCIVSSGFTIMLEANFVVATEDLNFSSQLIWKKLAPSELCCQWKRDQIISLCLTCWQIGHYL